MSLDLWVGMLGLAGLFILEGLLPFDVHRQGRWRHGARNLGLALTSGAVGAAMTPLLVLAMTLSAEHGLGLTHLSELPPLLAGVLAFVLFDLWMYLWHRANHRIPLLWRLHRVHHTDPAMDCTTALRFHPGEILLSSLANLPILILLGMSLEVLILYKSVMVATILFHHSNVAVPARLDRALRWVVVPPSMHRVHHSELQPETDSNYGTIFSLWDRLLGYYRRRDDQAEIRFGIGRFEEDDWQGVRGLLRLPFVT